MIGLEELLAARELADMELAAGLRKLCEREQIEFTALSQVVDGQCRALVTASSRPEIAAMVAGFVLGMCVARQQRLQPVEREGGTDG